MDSIQHLDKGNYEPFNNSTIHHLILTHWKVHWSYPMSGIYSALLWRLLKCSPLVVFSDPAFAVGEFVAPAWPLSDCFDIWSGEQCWMEMLINSHKCILVQVHVLPCIFVLVFCDFFAHFFMGKLPGCTLSPAWPGGFATSHICHFFCTRKYFHCKHTYKHGRVSGCILDFKYTALPLVYIFLTPVLKCKELANVGHTPRIPIWSRSATSRR